MSAPVFKSYSDGEYHYAFGEVYTPLLVDSDGETMTAEEIRKLAHEFIAKGLVDAIDLEHSRKASGVKVVESFIARENDPDYHAGAWVLGVRMKDGAIWKAIQDGRINGYSFQAVLDKEAKTVLVEAGKSFTGETFDSPTLDGVPLPEHKHTFYVEFDKKGQVSFGTTNEVFAHKHKISRSITTELALGHKHRFNCQ
jgi:hypothetical protein